AEIFFRAPIAAVETATAREVDRARDRLTRPPREHQLHLAAHALGRDAEELWVQVLMAPVELVDRRLVELEQKLIGAAILERIVPERFDDHALLDGLLPLALQLVSLLAVEARQEVVEALLAAPIPVVLD